MIPLPSPLARLLKLQRNPKPPTEPLALPGSAVYAAALNRLGEYNPKLQGQAFWRTVEQMRNNSRILALEYLLALPIISTHWEVRPAPNSATSQEASDALNHNLFETAHKDLYELLRLGTLARFYGVRFLEPTWQITNSTALIADYIDIHPLTIYKLNFDPRGNLISITQRVQTENTRTPAETEIPTDRLIRFTWREEGGNPLGYSDLRSLYPDWYRLEFLYTVLQIAAERAGIGAWQAKIPRDLWDNDQFRNALADTVRRIRTHESGAIVIPQDVSLEVLTAIDKQGIDGIIKMIEHYETNLAAGVLANILQVGMRDIGTQALAETLFEMFLYQLNQTCRWLMHTINRQLITRWLAYNYPQLPPNEHPKLHFTDLRLLLKREAVLNAIAQAANASLITADTNLEDYIRDILSLPPPPQTATETAHRAQPQTPTPPATTSTLLLQRNPQQAEQRFEQAMTAYLEQIEKTVAPTLQSLITAARNAPNETERALALARIQTLELPGRSQYESLLYDYLRTFAIEARAALQRDYNPNIIPEKLPESLNQYLLAKASTLARDHHEHLRAQLIYTALAEALKSTPALNPNELVRNLTAQRINTDLAQLDAETQALLERINEQLAES
jgi:phage gp29-like protein